MKTAVRQSACPTIKSKKNRQTLEHQVFGLLPYLQPDEAQVMKQITLQHFIVTAMRTSKVPAERRTSCRGRIRFQQGNAEATMEGISWVRYSGKDACVSGKTALWHK
jgi:hypothetical protein